MGIFVGDHDFQPVVVLTERRSDAGGHHLHVDGVVGERRGKAVAEVAVVDQHQLGLFSRTPGEFTAQFAMHLFGNNSGLAGNRFKPLVVVHRNVGSFQGGKSVGGIKARRMGESRHPEQQDKGGYGRFHLVPSFR